MTCKNCGAQLEPGSVFCGECGTPVSQADLNSAAVTFPTNDAGIQQPLPTGDQLPPKNSKKILKIVIPAAAAVAVCLIVGGVLLTVFNSPTKTVEKFMDGFEDRDGKAMYKQTSRTVSGMAEYYFDTLSIIYKNEIDEETGGDIDKYIQETFEEYYESQADSFYDQFEYELGKGYTTTYEIKEIEKAKKEDLKDFNDVLSRLTRTDEYNSKGLAKAEITVKGKSGSDRYEQEFVVILTKEGAKWRVLNVAAADFDFEDIYNSNNLQDFIF